MYHSMMEQWDYNKYRRKLNQLLKNIIQNTYTCKILLTLFSLEEEVVLIFTGAVVEEVEPINKKVNNRNTKNSIMNF